MINRKSGCLFLVIFIALMCCCVVSAADNTDMNSTANQVEMTGNQISDINTQTDYNVEKVDVQDKSIKNTVESGTNTKTLKNNTKNNKGIMEKTENKKIENINTNKTPAYNKQVNNKEIKQESSSIAVNTIIGHTALNATLVDAETGDPITNATLTVITENGTSITGITNNLGKLDLPLNLPAGEHTLNISFAGNSVYDGSSTTTKVNILKRTTTINTTIQNSTVGNVIINVTVNDLTIPSEVVSKGNVTIRNGETIIGTGKVVDGKTTITTNITRKGTYNLVVDYFENDFYLACNNSESLKDFEVIGKIADMNINVTNTTLGNTTLRITLFDPEENKNISNATIIITLPNGTMINGTTDVNGTVEIPVDLPVGNNTLNVTYPGDEIYSGINTTVNITISKRPSTTAANTIDNIVGNVTLNVLVTDKVTGNPVTSGNVNVTVNDMIIGRGQLTQNGTAIITTNLTTKGTYVITVNYEGNNNYTQSSTTLHNITVIGKNTQIITNIINNTIGNTTINITIVDPDNNTTVSDANITITLPDGTEINTTTDENGTVEIPVNIPVGSNDINITYDGNETYNGTNTTININVHKIATTVTVEPIKGIIGEKITFTAHVTDTNGNLVNGGNLVFKLNGKTLRQDGSFNSTAAPLKLRVVNGTVTYSIVADLYLRNTKNITASYSGSWMYEENKSDVQEAQIAKRYAAVTVNTVNITKQDTDIIFTAKIRDTTRDTKNTTAIDGGYVRFKVNGVTLKDDNLTETKVTVVNNTAQLTYHVPRGMASINGNGLLRNYTVTAIYTSDAFYPTARNTTQFNVQKSQIAINFKNVTVNNSTKVLRVTGNITDENNNPVTGTNKICVKINGRTLKDNRNRTIYYNMHNGNINITCNISGEYTKYNSVELVTGDRQAYTSTRSITSKIRII